MNNLILGGNYQSKFSDETCRVLLYDEFEIFYDSYWDELNKWTFSDRLNSTCAYYRTIPSLFSDAKLIKEVAFTEKEFSIFRPDLPLRFCRHKELNWQNKQFTNLSEYQDYLKSQNIELDDPFILEMPQIALYPFRPKRGFAKASIINALNSKYFTAAEILWAANNLQSVHLASLSNSGVGIFRLGHTKKMPSYYIGYYLDMAGFLKS